MKRTVEKRIRIAMRAQMTAIRSVRRLIDENPGHASLEVLRVDLSQGYARLQRALTEELKRQELARQAPTVTVKPKQDESAITAHVEGA